MLDLKIVKTYYRSMIKRFHLELLIRIKNVLTPEQQRELTRLRERGAGEGATARPPGS